MKTADLILFVLDSRDHLTPIDQSIADHLRKSEVPVMLLLNKADHEKQDLNLGEFSGLGFNDYILPLRRPWPGLLGTGLQTGLLPQAGRARP